MKKLLIHFSVCSALLLSACSVHKLEVQQGNVLEPEALEQLKTGMTQAQVKFLLGAPLLTDPFHPNRWDYSYTRKKSNEATESKHLVLIFDGDTLQKIDLRNPGKFSDK